MTAVVPRILAIMGSGETSPTMAKVHRDLLSRIGSPPSSAVLLDTPYGFQENADDISARAVDYFAESVQRPITVASFRSKEIDDVVAHESMLVKVRQAKYVFSGPGSPSYALSQWRESQIPAALGEKLTSGGCITFASAAATTLGPFALPVYEVYKVGEAPRWLDGLDLTSAAGLSGAVVVPHYNNAEGGNHDTRYCYMGERRLAMLEAMLPAGAYVLGVDEHTALILDLENGSATVTGRGVVSVRRRGDTTVIPTGETVPIQDLAARSAKPSSSASPASNVSASAPTSSIAPPLSPLLEGVDSANAAFEEALATGNSGAAVKAVLELDDLLVAWSRDTTQSDHLDQVRSVLRGLVVRLGEVAQVGMGDPREALAPLVDALLEARNQARADKRWSGADTIRDRLLAAGVAVHDSPEGTEWELA